MSTEAAQQPKARSTADDLLTIENLHVFYGNIAAVQGVSLKVKPGEIVALIGSNGAGKSTTLRTISGLIRPKQGSVVFEGKSMVGVPGHKVVGAGICQSPEGRRIFPRMTVEENLQLGAFLRDDRDGIAADEARVLDRFPRLKERIHQKAGTMSGGEQQMLAVGRALMGSPRLLLLDEPSMGLAPVLVDLIFDLVVEQNALAALRGGDYAYVRESGRLKTEGMARDLLHDDEVVNAYLGG